MLPVSGAEQLNTSAAMGDRPMISQSGAYSRLVRPAPRFVSRQEEVPETSRPGLGLQLFDDAARLPAVARIDLLGESSFIGIDVLVHESGKPLLDLFHFCRWFKKHE